MLYLIIIILWWGLLYTHYFTHDLHEEPKSVNVIFLDSRNESSQLIADFNCFQTLCA